jgi:hypothetical protein
MTKPLSLKGQYGRWKVLRCDGRIEKRTAWLCRCVCGTIRRVIGSSLTTGVSKSCGCGPVEMARNRTGEKNHAFKHGMTNTATFKSWQSMIGRCHNKNNSNYKNWGGRGIRVCNRWRQSFLNFLKDMGERPRGTSLGRRNNNLGYNKKNCRWETQKQQNRNRPGYNRTISHRGRMLTIAEWSEITGLKYGYIWNRVNKGQTIEQIIKESKT